MRTIFQSFAAIIFMAACASTGQAAESRESDETPTFVVQAGTLVCNRRALAVAFNAPTTLDDPVLGYLVYGVEGLGKEINAGNCKLLPVGTTFSENKKTEFVPIILEGDADGWWMPAVLATKLTTMP